METPKLFLTDYASYNNGTQFEFGHWVDLENFSDAEEFSEYIVNHFKECDKKSPLYGSIREEHMFTDYENFPNSLYAESMCEKEMNNLFEWINLEDDAKKKVEAMLDDGQDMEYAISHHEDVTMFEDTDEMVWEMFEMYYPGVDEMTAKCDYLTIDYRAFRDTFSKIEIDGEHYLVEYNY